MALLVSGIERAGAASRENIKWQHGVAAMAFGSAAAAWRSA